MIGVENTPTWVFDVLKFLVIDLGGTLGQIGMGQHGTAFGHAGATVGPAICYEGLYGDFCGDFVRRGAQFLAIISNDGWWGDTPGYKHLFSISRLRAIEHRRAIARSANTGQSGFISARGNVGQTLGWEQRGSPRPTCRSRRRRPSTPATATTSPASRSTCCCSACSISSPTASNAETTSSNNTVHHELHPNPRIPLLVAARLRNPGSDGLQAGIGAHRRILPPPGQSAAQLLHHPYRGTNGKGSVAHIIASVLQQAGYRTGLFTSPHLQDFRERIRVDGEMIPKQKVVNYVDKHREKMVDLELSFFEMTAAMAFDYFAQSDVEVAVIETGLGGRLDATNIVVPILSIITNIGLEHTALLGDTLQKIAAEKAGIVKKSIPVLIGEADERYDGVIEQAAAANKSKVIYAEREFRCESCTERGDRQSFSLRRTRDDRTFDVELDLRGIYQNRNVVTARPPSTSCTKRRR